MEKKRIIEIAQYCSEHRCPINVSMQSGYTKTGTALHLVKEEFLIIRFMDRNDLIQIAEIEKVECLLGRADESENDERRDARRMA
jgi:hypothetical protein